MTDDLTLARAAGDQAGDVTRELEQIAQQIPILPATYEQLRELLRRLDGGVMPTVRSARSAPSDPVAQASQFGVPAGIAGGPIGQSSGTEIGSGISSLDMYGTPALAGGGFPAAWRRFLINGVYNGDFGQQTIVPANIVDNIQNPLPYWTFFQSSGVTVTAKWIADAAFASGGKLGLSMSSSGASDQGYVEQLIPVNGSAARSFAYAVAATVIPPNGPGTPTAFLEAQFIKSDRVTTTGGSTLATTPATSGVGQTIDLVASIGLIPANAYYLRIRIGLFSTGAGQSVTNCAIGEVRLFVGPTRLYLAPNDTLGSPSYFEMNGRSVKLNTDSDVSFQSTTPYIWPAPPTEYPSSGDLVLVVGNQDIPGCTVTYNPGTDEYAIVTGIFDVDVSVASTATAIMSLYTVETGVAEAATAQFRVDPVSVGRAMVTQQWFVQRTHAASRTFRLRATKSLATGTITVKAGHTKMLVQRIGR